MGSFNKPDGPKPDAVDKFLTRMKTVFKRSKPSEGEPSKKHIPPAAPATASPTTAPTPSSLPAAATDDTKQPPTERLDSRNVNQREKAKALFEKYGLKLHDDEWIVSTRSPAQRVEKPIRMRIRWQCHQCQATFGVAKVCTSCQHRRCQNCTRTPALKARKAEMEAADIPRPKKTEVLLTKPSKTGGPDLVRRPVRQRVRRYCHKCDTLFAARSTECGQCKHLRCRACPRDPPKLKKWPDGYEGDVDADDEVGPKSIDKLQARLKALGITSDEPRAS